MQILFKIIRQRLNNPAWVQTYTLDVSPTATILDCLNQIKWEQDGSLAFRKNCRNTICGSCALRINGRAALACQESVEQQLQKLASLDNNPNFAESDLPTLTLAPLGNMPVIKDFVVDMQSFWGNLKAIDPYISTAGRQIPEREFLQSPQERAKLDQMGNCILCGACYSDCNGREVSAEFVGPHALAKAYRTLADNRDQATASRLEKYDGLAGVWGCTRCFNCNSVCPMDVAPLDQINQIKGQILDKADRPPSRSLRHRRILIDLVKQGGWIDERKFGLQVMGNRFRDLRGLISLVPLGWRMLQRGKFPTEFTPSAGTSTVRALINAVKSHRSSP